MPSTLRAWLKRLLLAVGPLLFYLFTSLIFRTCRVTLIGKEHEDRFLREGKPILFVSWHQGLLYFVFHFRNRNGIVMASRSKDGDVVSRILQLYGFQAPPRGSSSTGGKEAMYEMIDRLRATEASGGLVADAPRGPFGVAKPGIIKIAKETGLPLIPVMWWPRRAHMFRNWDRTLLPLPFTRIVFYYDAPMYVAADATPEAMESARATLTDRLNRMHETARGYFAPVSA
jgi:lysophospholipid acyltransferase (LPLAT)-like uncharacterized protein